MAKNLLAFLFAWASVSWIIFGFKFLTKKEKTNVAKVLFKGLITAIIAAVLLYFIVVLF